MSENPLNGVKLALVQNGIDEDQPMDMRLVGNDGLNWSVDIPRPDPERDRLHLVALSGQTLYFGDVATSFTATSTENE